MSKRTSILSHRNNKAVSALAHAPNLLKSSLGEKLPADKQPKAKFETVTPCTHVFPVDTPIKLGPSSYSAAAILPLCQIGQTKAKRIWNFVQVMMLYISNILVQGGLIWFVKDIKEKYVDSDGECGAYKTTTTIRLICILLYTVSLIQDWIESLMIGLWAWYFPAPTKENAWEPLTYTVVYQEEDDDTVGVFKTGMTKCYKFYIFSCIVIPKLALAFYLLVFGAGFIVATDSDQDLVLNSLALQFILTIDELLFEYFVPGHMKAVIESIPNVEIGYIYHEPEKWALLSQEDRDKQHQDEKASNWLLTKLQNKFLVYGMSFKLLLIVVVSFATFLHVCPDGFFSR